MKTFTINGISYTAKDFDFNLICDLEDMGVPLEKVQEKPLSMVRGYFALCAGKGNNYAGNEIQAHTVNGGNLEEITNVMSEKMEESDFFRALSKTEEKEITEKERPAEE